MRKNLVPTFILIAYCAILIKVMVFKDIPTIRAGGLMLNFAGTNAGHGPNFVPFKTIVPYLLGWKGWIIAGINLAGNIALLVPIGLLVPFVSRNMTWQKALVLGLAAGLGIELTQTVLRVGIFDIDDVILNACGVVLGYRVFAILARWARERSYRKITIATLATAGVGVAFYGGVVYPATHQPVIPERPAPQTVASADLCGGSGGTGEIVGLASHTMTIRRNDGVVQALGLTNRTTIRTSAGPASEADLKTGDRVTVVVYDREIATTVLKCSETL
ncbi:MAG TPA: VanZ family protein [Gemmatimonadales bacterium]|nr:VanZ family protein [Gemmatimonadales bacterium]